MTAQKNAESAHRALKKMINEQAVKEAQSEYDRSVCIAAVGAARRTFEDVEIAGSATDYVIRVYAAINKLQDTYNDSDGQYTNGKASIGSVLGRISELSRELED